MANYWMDGRHKTKVHLAVKTHMGSNAWCGQHTSYSKTVMNAEDFKTLAPDKQCKRCARALETQS